MLQTSQFMNVLKNSAGLQREKYTICGTILTLYGLTMLYMACHYQPQYPTLDHLYSSSDEGGLRESGKSRTFQPAGSLYIGLVRLVLDWLFTPCVLLASILALSSNHSVNSDG